MDQMNKVFTSKSINIFLFGSILFCIVKLNKISSQELTKKKINICFTWETEFKDGRLTHNIKKGSNNNDLKKLSIWHFLNRKKI